MRLAVSVCEGDCVPLDVRDCERVRDCVCVAEVVTEDVRVSLALCDCDLLRVPERVCVWVADWDCVWVDVGVGEQIVFTAARRTTPYACDPNATQEFPAPFTTLNRPTGWPKPALGAAPLVGAFQ